jgi:integrase
MRPKELYSLRWEDVDLPRGAILVRASKTNTYRAIEMTPLLRATLARHAEHRESNYVFAYRGKPIKSAKKAFERICQRAEIDGCTLYTLRHTFASHLAMQGVPLLYIQRLMGHERSSTTEIYAHLSSESQRGHAQCLLFADPVEEDE